MAVACDQCDEIFDHNYQLYKHKVDEHGPVTGIVTETFKRPVAPYSGKYKHAKKYRKTMADEQPNLKQSEETPKDSANNVAIRKRDRPSDSDENDNPAKQQKIENYGKKRTVGAPASRYRHVKKYRKVLEDSEQEEPNSSDSDDELNVRKIRKVERRGIKRFLESDSDERTSKNVKIDKNNTQSDVSGSEDGTPSKRFKLSTKSPIHQSRASRNEIGKWKKRYKTLLRRYDLMKEECDTKIRELDQQLAELKEFDGDYELKTMSKAVINSVTIDDLNKIQNLVSNNQLHVVLRTRKYLLALRKLFLGLSYGVIPITAPQRVAISDDERAMVKQLENASVDHVSTFIKQNKEVFLRLFSIISSSIKLVTKSYMRYGDGI